MKNPLVAQILYKIADLLEIQEVEFKPRAFRRAAASIESLEEDIEELARKNKLQEIPGVGEGISKKILEIIQTGTCKEYEQLKKEVPVDIDGLMKVEGLGPKKIKFLYKKLHIRNLKDLEAAVKLHKLQKLEGFGEKTEQNFAQALGFIKKSSGRFLLSYSFHIAQDIKQYLQKKAKKVEVAGSLRRWKETIGDVDILAVGNQEVMDFFTKYKETAKVLARGETRSSIMLSNGLRADLRLVPERSFGAALNYFTGSKEHNIELRKIAIKKGWKLNEYGLFRGNTQIAGKTEEEVYKKLGLQYIEPELRENQGEIEASRSKKLPILVQQRDIKADIHVHSTWSDGSASIEEMAKAAMALGYEYLAITDHFNNPRIANPLDKKRLEQQGKEVDKLNKKYSGFIILKGAEVNINLNGSLDIDAKTAQQLDIVVASLHSGFKNNPTARILKAMENRYTTFIAHPSAREINKREGASLDYKRIFMAAKETSTLLEINASPERLDLDSINAKHAQEDHCQLIINTDAHAPTSLQYMKFGIGVARRAWCSKKNIANTQALPQFRKIIKNRQA